MNEITSRQPLINRDNAVHYVNAYLNYKNLEATTELTDYVAELNQSMQVQTDVSRRILASSISNNTELKRINEGMNAISESVDRLATGMERQEQLHREHYDTIKRERSAKEVIYQFERYLIGIREQSDSISKAFGARRLLATVEHAGFSTADLGDISDKRYFDDKLREAKELESGLSSDSVKELEKFELLYSSLDALTDDALEGNLENLTLVPEQPQAPQLPKGASRDQLTKMRDLSRRDKISTRAFAAGVGVTILIGILGGVLGESSKGGVALILGLLLLAAIVCAIGGMIGMFVMKTRLAITGKFKSYRDLAKAMEQYDIALKQYESESRGIEEVKMRNEHVQSNNRKLLTELGEFKLKLQSEINTFLDSHPGIQTFCPKV